MSDAILIAIITTVPPTVAALFAVYHSIKLKRPVNEINSAVNNRKPGERKLVELVEDLRDSIVQVQTDLDKHRAWHTVVNEADDIEKL